MNREKRMATMDIVRAAVITAWSPPSSPMVTTEGDTVGETTVVNVVGEEARVPVVNKEGEGREERRGKIKSDCSHHTGQGGIIRLSLSDLLEQPEPNPDPDPDPDQSHIQRDTLLIGVCVHVHVLILSLKFTDKGLSTGIPYKPPPARSLSPDQTTHPYWNGTSSNTSGQGRYTQPLAGQGR